MLRESALLLAGLGAGFLAALIIASPTFRLVAGASLLVAAIVVLLRPASKASQEASQ